jgi:hypothetical protein
MIPKEKAKELVNKYYRIIPLDKMTIYYNLAKKCALIAADEVLKAHLFNEKENHYFFEVKQEIEKL